MEMTRLKRNNISYKEKSGRPRNAQKYKKPNSAIEQPLKRVHFCFSENAPVVVLKTDAFFTQASYISLERESVRTIGPFYVLINKPISATQVCQIERKTPLSDL